MGTNIRIVANVTAARNDGSSVTKCHIIIDSASPMSTSIYVAPTVDNSIFAQLDKIFDNSVSAYDNTILDDYVVALRSWTIEWLC